MTGSADHAGMLGDRRSPAAFAARVGTVAALAAELVAADPAVQAEYDRLKALVEARGGN